MRIHTASYVHNLFTWPWTHSTENNGNCFSRHWLGNSNNTIFPFTMVLSSFGWSMWRNAILLTSSHGKRTLHSLNFLLSGFRSLPQWSMVSYLLVACLLTDILPLSAYIDTGWGPTTAIRSFLFRKKRRHIRLFGWLASSKIFYDYLKSLTKSAWRQKCWKLWPIFWLKLDLRRIS